MLRYKTETRPGLVALYDIRLGNGVGQFLQHRSPHGLLLFIKFHFKDIQSHLGLHIHIHIHGYTLENNDNV